MCNVSMFFFFSSRRRHTRYWRDWSSDVCSSDLGVKSQKTQSTHMSPREKEQADENLGQRWTQRFLPRRSKEGQQVHENLFTLIKSEAKANPNRNDVAAHCGQNGSKDTDRKHQVSERRWREGKPPALLVAVETGAATRPSGVELPPKFKNPCPI